MNEWIVERLMPAGEVHLLGGPSGSGKTTWLFQFLKDWAAGEPILDYKSYPTPFIYISCDRSLKSVKKTMTRAGVDFPCFSLIDHNMVGKPHDVVINTVKKEYPDAKLFVIDGFTSLCPNGKINDYKVVSLFLSGLAKDCQKLGITILGIVHTSKSREGERLLNPRERIIGSTAWASYSDTIIVIEPTDQTDGSSKRSIDVLPRNSANIRMLLQFSTDGRLLPVSESEEVQEGVEFILGSFIAGLDASVPLPVELFADWGNANQVPKRTVQRALAKAIDLGLIKRTKPGVYTKPAAA